MIKNKKLLLGFFGAILVLLAICVSALSFNAHAAAPSSTTTTTVHAYIIKTTNGYVYKRTAITTSIRNAFEFTNDTAVSQTVMYRGASLFTIAAKTSAPYTFPKAGTYLFKLASNRLTSLTVTAK
jgi:hypothetical protein